MLVNRTLLTTGAPTLRPSTLCAALLEIAWAPRPSPACVLVPAAKIRPRPQLVSAPAAMLIPSKSKSDRCTGCRNTSDDVPCPRAYLAARSNAPIPRTMRGGELKFTSTARFHVTVTSIQSPALNVESLDDGDEIDTPVTPVPMLPSTLCAAAFAIAWAPSARFAFTVSPATLIVPPFSTSTGPTLNPSASLSDACTKYRK